MPLELLFSAAGGAGSTGSVFAAFLLFMFVLSEYSNSVDLRKPSLYSVGPCTPWRLNTEVPHLVGQMRYRLVGPPCTTAFWRESVRSDIVQSVLLGRTAASALRVRHG